MEGALINLLITAIIIGIIVGIILVVWKLVAPRLPPPIGEITTYILWGIIAIIVVLYLLVPLIRMIPAA